MRFAFCQLRRAFQANIPMKMKNPATALARNLNRGFLVAKTSALQLQASNRSQRDRVRDAISQSRF